MTTTGPNHVRQLARLCGTFHNVTYYAPGMSRFRDVGVKRYWHGYLAYRSAPLGRVPTSVVTATFYNFAPSLVAEAIPSVWDHVTPDSAMALRDEAVDESLRRGLAELAGSEGVVEALGLIRDAVDGEGVESRPLFAAHADLAWPDEPHLALHHACTLWREQRGDSHNLALAHADLDGIACHVLLAGRGVGNAATIEKIRGWSRPEWDEAHDRLVDRGLVDATGQCTDAGLELRAGIEDDTDRLARGPVERLGPARASRLVELMTPLVERLVETEAVSASWPPKSATVERMT